MKELASLISSMCRLWLRAVHKRRPYKIDPLCPHWLNPSPRLSVRKHHKFRKIRSFFAPERADVRIWRPPPLSEKCPHWTNPTLPLTADIFYAWPPYWIFEVNCKLFFDFFPLNLLLAQSHQAEIIVVKHLIQEVKDTTRRVGVERISWSP